MKVFISSTYKDLIEYSKAAYDATKQVDLTGFRRATIERVDSDSLELRLTQATVKPVRS